MTTIETEIDIDAPPARVWAVLTGFGDYPRWNPFIRSVAGEATEGGALRVVVQPPGGSSMTFRPRVLRAEPARELRWLGRLIAPGVFDGEHVFQLEARGAGTRFTHAEHFRGLLVPLLKGSLAKTRRGFEAMNAALKAEAEAR